MLYLLLRNRQWLVCAEELDLGSVKKGMLGLLCDRRRNLDREREVFMWIEWGWEIASHGCSRISQWQLSNSEFPETNNHTSTGLARSCPAAVLLQLRDLSSFPVAYLHRTAWVIRCVDINTFLTNILKIVWKSLGLAIMTQNGCDDMTVHPRNTPNHPNVFVKGLITFTWFHIGHLHYCVCFGTYIYLEFLLFSSH